MLNGGELAPPAVTVSVVAPTVASNGICKTSCPGAAKATNSGLPPTVAVTAEAVDPKFVPKTLASTPGHSSGPDENAFNTAPMVGVWLVEVGVSNPKTSPPTFTEPVV